MSNPWLFDPERLETSPSSKDGILKLQGARFIQRLGARELELHYCTVATGAVFFHRFYMFHPFSTFPVYPMAATCLFLAGKVEETPKKSNDIVKYSKAVLSEQDFLQFGPDPKEEILTLERILLQTLRFDLEVEHPYEHLIKYVKRLTVVKIKDQNSPQESAHRELLQSAWTFINDSFCTTVCLKYEPEIVAIAMIWLGCKTQPPPGIEVRDWEDRTPQHKNWWDSYVENLDSDILEDICHQVLDVYQYSSIKT